MIANLLLFKPALLPNGDIERYSTCLSELVSTKNLATRKGDLVFKPGGWNDIVLNDIISMFKEEDNRKLYFSIVRQLRFLFDNRNSIALDIDPNSIEELNQHLNTNLTGLLGIDFDQRTEYCISDQTMWYQFHRFLFVDNPPAVKKFCSELSPYFENIYFNDTTVSNYLNTLKGAPYNKMMKTLMFHLTALDSNFHALFKEYRKEGVPKVCERLQYSLNGKPIAFGCSTDRGDLPQLEIDFTDVATGKILKLKCDPHTKIWGYLEDDIEGDHGDRIYFHEPIDGFIDGKILLARIGYHRN